ncbi:MAG: DUF459 domain-containing protein [Acidimicrobiia bacterium]
MAPSDRASMPPDDTAPASRRDRRQQRRRRLVRGLFVAGAVAGGFAVTGTALALTGVVDVGGDDPELLGERAAASATTAPAVTGDATPSGSCRSPLDPDDPLRLWIGGDSLAGSVGPSLGDLTAKTGVVQPVFYSKVSSGLMSPDFFDWPERGGEEMFKLDPEVAVFIIGANDTPVVQDDASEWRPRYEQLVERMMTLLIGDGRAVYWVGAPVLEDRRSEKVRQLNEVFQTVAGRHPEVTYVDAYTLFTGPDGEYASSLPDGAGETVRVRADDGVHFTPEGGDRLAGAVFASLDPRCAITTQAVPGAAKQTIETEGSSRVPGTSRESRTTVTTTAAAAPASTAPPAPPTTAPSTSAPPTSASPTTTTLLPDG